MNTEPTGRSLTEQPNDDRIAAGSFDLDAEVVGLVDALLARFAPRSLIAGSEAVDALLDLRTAQLVALAVDRAASPRHGASPAVLAQHPKGEAS